MCLTPSPRGPCGIEHQLPTVGTSLVMFPLLATFPFPSHFPTAHSLYSPKIYLLSSPCLRDNPHSDTRIIVKFLLNTRIPAFICNVYHRDHELFLKCFSPSACWVSCPLAAHCFAHPSSSGHPRITAWLPPNTQHIPREFRQSPEVDHHYTGMTHPVCLLPRSLSRALDSDIQLPPDHLHVAVPQVLQINMAEVNSSPF